MRHCPQCGAQNPDAAAFCGACGTPFPAKPYRPAQTMLGVALPSLPAVVQAAPAPAPQEPAAPPQSLRQTAMGMPPMPGQPAPAPPPAPPPPAHPPASAMPSAAKTMLGVAMPFAVPDRAPPPAPPPPAPAPAVVPSPPEAAPTAPQPEPPRAVTTRRNVSPAAQSSPLTPAPPAAFAPAPAAAPPVAPAPVAPVAPVAPAPAPAPMLSKGRTVMMQAPVGFGAPKGKLPKGHQTVVMQTPVAPPVASAGKSFGRKTFLGFRAVEPELVEEWYDEVVDEEGEVERRVRVVEKPLPPVYKRPAFFLILGAVGLLGAGTVLAVLLKSSPPLVVEPRVDANGKDLVHVTCSSCPDGTTLSIAQGAKVPVAASAADVPLPSALKIGDNHLAIVVDRPEGGRDETVEVDVKVAFRVWPELGGLQDPTPAVRVLIEALPGSTVTVAGKPVVLGADGKGTARVDVSDDLTGLSREAKTLAREVAYTVAAPGGTPVSGKLDVKMGVVPLLLDSPGLKMTTDQPNFMLAGRTVRGGGLLVAGRPISVTPEGTFAQLMNISAVGATNVELRATAPNLAPRIATITVKRVASLAQEMKDVESQTKTGFSDVAGKEPSGAVVAWRGEIVSSAAQGHLTAAVVDVATGCPKKPCRARFTVPGATALASGDKVFFFGKVTGTVDAGDQKLPSIEAEFAVKNP